MALFSTIAAAATSPAAIGLAPIAAIAYYASMVGLGAYQAYLKRRKLRLKQEKLDLLRRRAEVHGTDLSANPQPANGASIAVDMTTPAEAISAEEIV